MARYSRKHGIALLGGLVALLLLAVLLNHYSRVQLDREQVTGTYRMELPLMFAVADPPTTVELHPDGRIRTSGPKGELIHEGTWWWDPTEGWVRSDDPALDYRIRGYLGWTGPKLFWRVQPQIYDMVEFTLEPVEP